MAVLFVHSDPAFRDAFGVALRMRGVEIAAYETVQDALSEATRTKPIALLVEPALLFREAEELGPRLAKIAGRAVRIVALTNRPSAQEREFFKRHRAESLAGPIEDVERIVKSLERVAAGGGDAPAPWEASSTTISAPWESEAKTAPRESAPWESAPAKAPHGDNAGPRAPAASPQRGGFDEEWLFGDTHDIELPVPTVPPGALPAVAQLRGVDDAQLARDGKGATILVVDDDATFRFFLCEALAGKNYRVYISINAPNALRFLKSGAKVDLIVSDVNMPHMDGFELKHEADKALGRRIPFIALTGEALEERAEAARTVGVNGLLSKPIHDIDGFYQLVRDALAGKAHPPRG